MLRGSYLRKWAKPISMSSTKKPLGTIPMEFQAYMPTLECFSELISMGNPSANERSATGEQPHPFYSWPRWRSYQCNFWKPPQRIRITKVVTSTLMRGFLPNLFHIKYI